MAFSRQCQLKELKSFIDGRISKELRTYQDSKYKHEVILLVGNFNIDGRKMAGDGTRHSQEYMIMKTILEGTDARNLKMYAFDLLYYSKDEHPITYGDIDENNKPMETILTHPKMHGAQASMDYIFLLDLVDSEKLVPPDSPPKQYLKVDICHTNVEKFTVLKETKIQDKKAPENSTSNGSGSSYESLEEKIEQFNSSSSDGSNDDSRESFCETNTNKKGQVFLSTLNGTKPKKIKFTQLSDHYGISTIIRVRNNV